MILRFPSLDTLRLALTSGVIPEALRTSAVRFTLEDDTSLWVETAARLSAATEKDLQRLGVQFPQERAYDHWHKGSHWLQMLALTRLPPQDVDVGDRTPVLFELAQPEALAELATEILRLGNDRQSFRWLGDGTDTRTLLRVIGPPYYSLLRALDAASLQSAPWAYREVAPQLWIQVGYTHPLAEHLHPPPGQLLLLRAPHHWTCLPDARWRDIYEIIDFQLPQAPVPWRDQELQAPIRVPVKLSRRGSSEAAELWVLREQGIAQLEEMVRSSDNELLARFSFTVAVRDEERIVVLRVRPSRNPPPVLVLDALALRSYLRIANLFVPVGMTLHPPLRRDAVIRLLAENRTRITWLVPHADHTFTPESLPDDAFRPLSAWIDYVLEHDHQAIQAWIGAARFDFEGFVCTEDSARQKKPPREPSSPQPVKKSGEKDVTTSSNSGSEGSQKKKPKKAETPAPDEIHVEPGELEKRLRTLEEEFSALKTPLDDPRRGTLWRELATLNSALHYHSDAALCWSNGLWEEPGVPVSWPQAWYRQELKQQAASLPPASQVVRLVQSEPATHAQVRIATAYLIWSAALPSPPADLLPHLYRLQQFFEKHEGSLGVRTVWLIWQALHQLAGGDVLMLARARDRLLERLFVHGLTPELDLPGFLRFAGLQSSHRFHTVRDQIVRLRRHVQDWARRGTNPVTTTHAYIDLIFAFGLARLGESQEVQKLRQEAAQVLAHADEVHSWLYEAFEFRIQQALDNKPGMERLPERMLQQLDALEHPDFLQHVPERQQKEAEQTQRMLRLKIDRLREKSRILEPHERIGAYRRWIGVHDDELTRELLRVSDLHDRLELTESLRKLLTGKRKFKGVPRPETRILTAAIELAPRLGQAFGEEVLDRVPAQIERGKDAEEIAQLLEKSLLLAAHYDRKDDVQRCVTQFQGLLQDPRTISYEKLIPLFSGSFRSLRKFGLRDEAAQLLQRLEKVIHADATLLTPARAGSTGGHASKRLVLLLELASGWFFFGEDAKARKILDEAHDVLLRKELYYTFQIELARAYLAALEQAPMELAMARIMEFFRKVEGVHDLWTTQSHYSLSRLIVVEAMVLTLISDDFTLDRAARQRLDEEEFLVRRRIHRDMRQALAHAGI